LAATALLGFGLTACGGGGDGGEAPNATPQAAIQSLRIQAAAQSVANVPTADAATRLMNFAESNFPNFFPGSQANQNTPEFVFRYYPATQVYIGVARGFGPYLAGHVYVVGPPFGNTLANPQDVGPLTNYVSGGGASATAVSAIASVAPLSYRKDAQIAVTGSQLDQGITLTAPGCSELSEQPGSTATTKTYRCKVATATALSVKASNSAGDLLTVALTVPDPQVTLVTSLGTVVLELNPAKAAATVDNFLKYVGDGFYTGLLFHRVIPTFVVQGGGFANRLVAKTPTYPAINLESNKGLSNVRGSLAMARTNEANSATSQFYINVADNLSLDYASAASPGYAVFGKVVDGLPVVDAIRMVPTGTRNGLANVPVADVTIVSATQTR
jgi:peptidyl-prolyl cis-trans isomerase A (cyclophilin A)